MTEVESVCLLNDSFPPYLDGVANTVYNYAFELEKLGRQTSVITPGRSGAGDKDYPYSLIRYPGIPGLAPQGYVAGIPFSPAVAGAVKKLRPEVYHNHCPIASGFLVRSLREIHPAPLIFTYHTKFDVDIENVFSSRKLAEKCKRILVENISASDEVWTVSRGAGENLEKIGFCGEWRVMKNGVDLPRGRVADGIVDRVTGDRDIPPDVTVYLYVGRLMWYKGIRLILDGLKRLSDSGRDFRAVFIGKGDDSAAVADYCRKLGLEGKCIFPGPEYDRERLRAWYCRADVFLFLSSYDTNGLVVREAASCGLPALLIRDSCAAEDVRDGVNGFLTDEDPEAVYYALCQLYGNPELTKSVGERAMNGLYISWEDAVRTANEGYAEVREKWLSGGYDKKRSSHDGLWRRNGKMMDFLSAGNKA